MAEGPGRRGAPRKLDDPKIRKAFLTSLSLGKTRAEACKAAGIDYRTMRNTEKSDPEFAEQVMDAEEISFDPVEKRVRQMATAGDSFAIKEYRSMKRRREAKETRERKIQVEQTHTHVLEANETLRELIGTLRQRAVSASIDVDYLELERNDVE